VPQEPHRIIGRTSHQTRETENFCVCARKTLMGLEYHSLLNHLLFGPLANPIPVIWFLGSDTGLHEQIGTWKSEVDGTLI